MDPTTIVYFAELNTDNSISKIIELSSHLANDTANRFSPAFGAIACRKLMRSQFLFSDNVVGTGSTFTVVYCQYTYQVYPNDGSLVGGAKTYAWDSGNSCWTSGSSSYTWNNTSFSWDVS